GGSTDDTGFTDGRSKYYPQILRIFELNLNGNRRALCLVYDLAVEHRQPGSRGRNVGRGDLEQVARKHHQIGVFAGSDRAEAIGLAGEMGRAYRVALDSLGHGQSLLRIPAAGRLARLVLSRHGGVDAQHRIEWRDGRVGAEGQRRTPVEERAEGVGISAALAPNAVGRAPVALQ